MPRRSIIITVSWIAAFAIALTLDTPVARYVHASGLGHFVEGKRWSNLIKAPGDIRFAIGAAAVVWACRQIRWKQAVFVALAGMVSGANGLIKWMAGRYRPYKFPRSTELEPFHLRPFWHGFHGIGQHDLCFPSGHESAAGALAAAMLVVWPRGWWIFLVLAVLVGIERVAENAHYSSDVVGAAGFAMLGTAILTRLLSRWMSPAELI